MSVRSSLFALFLIERHRYQNEGPLKSEERLSDLKERCAQLCYQGCHYRGAGTVGTPEKCMVSYVF